jgi:23S rRNA-/tRNA-specific pseudouridylate synthase
MKILRETLHDVAVVKPSGMATEMQGDRLGESLLTKLSSVYPSRTVKLPHRLDKITRGIVLAALSDEAVRYYNLEIQEGLWDKYYLGRIHHSRNRDEKSSIRTHKAFLKQKGARSIIVKSGGAPSFLEILAIEPVPNRPDESHALIRLLTGRYHQIRVMFEGLGIPLVGDPIYTGDRPAFRAGSAGDFYLEHIVLRYRDFSSKDVVTLHLEDDPDRETISDEMKKQIEKVRQTR